MDNLLETKECRICLTDDLIGNMISPCLCIGTNKYVHHECLKTFIILSDNSLFKKECYICKYKYNYEFKDIHCNVCNITLFFINILLTLFLLILIYYNIYNILYSSLLTFIIILPFIYNFITMSNKKILAKLYYNESILIPIITLISGLYLLQFNVFNIYGFYFENLSIFMLWNIHYKCLHKINKFNHFKILSIDNV